MNQLKYNILVITVIILLGVGLYSFNLNNGLFWDDNDWIINNNYVHQISWDNIKFWLTNNTLAGVGLQSNYYRPFLFFTFALNWVVSETKPFLWHFVSNSIHIANAVLVFLLLKRYTGRIVSFLTALIFTIHPLNTEAVTYIAGRGDSLSVFFMLLALIFYIKAGHKKNQPETQGDTFSSAVEKKYVHRSLSIFRLFSFSALVLAILSRETGVIFPFLLMVFYISFISREGFVKSLKKAFFEALPYFGIVAVYGILRLTVLNFQNTLNFYAAPNLYSENIIYRLFTFMHVLVDYLRLLFIPTGLHMERSMTVHTSLFQWPVWLGGLIIIGILAMLYRLYKKKHPDFKVWLFGWGWFFVGLAMVSGIVPINAVMYEHWLYLPMIGFWFIIAHYLSKLFNYQGSTFLKIQGRTLILAALATYLSFFGYQSIQRNLLWGDPLAFYLDILKYESDSVRINNNVGNTYYDRKDVENAEKYYRIAASQEGIFAEPHFNLGSIFQARGDIFGAIKEFEKAIEINPNFFYPYQNLAVIYAQQGNFTKAGENMEKLKMLIPNNPRVYYNSALIYIATNNKKKALEDINTGLMYSDRDPDIRKLLEELAGQLSK
ncbi:MAG: tetratricopeptide repeat protein [bacterium]|nr:tetratricopeptide repeat protein [bacterium]